jgi:hypothetical protein
VDPQTASGRDQGGQIVGQGHSGDQQDAEELVDQADFMEEDEAQQTADVDEGGRATTVEQVEEVDDATIDYSYRDFLTEDLRDDTFFRDDIFGLEPDVSEDY